MLGRAVPEARIDIYLDDRLAGRGNADGAGAWSLTLDKSVPEGHYRLRIEAIDQGGQPAQRLAERSFGEGQRYTEIFQANQSKIRDPNLIYPGQVFAVPAQR